MFSNEKYHKMYMFNIKYLFRKGAGKRGKCMAKNGKICFSRHIYHTFRIRTSAHRKTVNIGGGGGAIPLGNMFFPLKLINA